AHGPRAGSAAPGGGHCGTHDAPATGTPGGAPHRRYLSRHGTPSAIGDLTNHALIGFDQMTGFNRSAGKALSGWRRESFALRTDNNLAQLALIRSGAGIGVCQV